MLQLNKRNMVKGFSLLELLIVLIIMGSVSTIALPQIQRSLEAYQFSVEKSQVLSGINTLVNISYRNASQFEILKLPSGTTWIDEHINIPRDWSVYSREPITFYPNGSCSGGTIVIQNQKETFNYELPPPYCLALPVALSPQQYQL